MYCQKLNVVAFLAIILVSCAKEEKRTDIVTFPLKGEVVEIDTARNRLMVAHEEIPNYMMAMTMPFKVKNRALLYDLRVGDTITATLAVSRTESWLETITVVGKGEEPDPQLVAGAIMARMLKPGDMLPDDSYINQDGRRIRLSDFKGKAVALTFIYTRCPLPDYCILMSNNFGKVQRLLAQDRSLEGKWHLITVSFDPKFDSPRVLKEYGKSYRADFASWDFVTDPDTSGKTIMRLADGLGLTYENDEGGLIAHNLRTVVLDKEGRIRKVIQGNEWKAEEVAEELRKLAR
jgi:protein SCO1/2